MDVTRLIIVINLQNIQVTNHYTVYLKLIYVNHISIKKKLSSESILKKKPHTVITVSGKTQRRLQGETVYLYTSNYLPQNIYWYGGFNICP